MDTTTDAFLNGKVMAVQPSKGYRAGVDAVLLAACVPARSGERILELGCGVGVVSLCLAARIPNLDITGIEVQPLYASLAASNGVTAVMADLRSLPNHIRNTQYHHVMANPPYFDRNEGSSAPDTGRDVAMGGNTPLGDWLDVAAKRLAPKGYFTLILRIERLPEVLNHLQGRLGSIIVRPISARNGDEPYLFLLQARHSGRAPFRLLAPLIMHEGTKHDKDCENYTRRVNNILRYGDALIITD